MANYELNIGRNKYDDLFNTDESRKTEEIKPVKLSELKPYEQQPFKVLLDESMNELVESIQQSGILTPIVARPHKDGGYEILSGHRRAKACEIAGIDEVPVVIKDLDDDTATILLVDSNLQREHILPSEKAYAYQMKLEAIKNQGKRNDLTSAQIVPKSMTAREQVAKEAGVNRMEVSRYIRLTNLIDDILDKVDAKEIALNAAVELSYLGSKEQAELFQTMESEDAAPSIAQAKKLREFAEEGRLNPDVILSIMREEKPEKRDVTLKENDIKDFIPKNFTKQQTTELVIKLLKKWHKERRKEMER